MLIIKENFVSVVLVIFIVVGNSNKLFFGSAKLLHNGISSYVQNEIAKFVGEAVSVSHCSVFLVLCKQQELRQNKTFSNEIGTEILLETTNVITTIITTVLSGTVNQSIESTRTTNTLLKHTPTCNFVVTVIHEIKLRFYDSFLAFLTSTNNEKTKRDEDYYMFVTSSESVSKRLLLSKLGAHLRFKITICPKRSYNSGNALKASVDLTQVPFIINTVCIYCPDIANKITVLPKTENKLDQKLLSQLFPDFTRNMHLYSIRISAPTKYVPTYEMENTSGQFRHKRGIHTLNFNAVAEKINLSYTLQPCTKFGNVPEGSSGVYLGNGLWAGCVGDVVRGISDMALSISPDHRRFEYVHFTSAMEYTYVTYTTSKPSLFFSWTTIFTALSPIIWGFVISSILVASTAISIIDYYYLTEHVSWKITLDKLCLTGIYMMGYLVGQDVPSPNSLPVKSIYISWLFYGILIGAMYSCSLQAVIVSPGLFYIPRTFSELVHSNYKWGASTGFRNGLGEQLFKNSDNKIMRDIYDKMEGDKDSYTCTQKALSQYACFNWELMERFIFQTEFIDKSGNHPFQMSTDTAFFVSLNFITRKREIFRSHFNDFLKRSYDSGLAKQTVAMDWRGYRMNVFKTRKNKFQNQSTVIKEGPKSFKFENVKGGFIVLLCGLIISATINSMEHIYLQYYDMRVKEKIHKKICLPIF